VAALPLAYHAMRLRWCGWALLAFLRRWGVYGLVAVAVIGAGAASAIEIVSAVAAWLVLPLFRAAGEPAWLLPAVLLQSLLGCLLVWGMRPLLWPARWAEAERALPLASVDVLLSDAIVVAIGLVPLLLLYGVGASTLLIHDPAWLRPLHVRAVASLLAVIAGTVGGGVALLAWQRRAVGVRSVQRALQAPIAPGGNTFAAVRRAHWGQVLLAWPLWRGPARRTGHAMTLAAVLLCVPGLGLFIAPAAASWWLAAFAAGLLYAVTRIESLARADWLPLYEACSMLPLRPAALRRARAGVALLPALPGALVLVLSLPHNGVRRGVLWAYAAACLLACLAELPEPPDDAGTRSARWLFSLVVLLALASEVMA